MFKKFVIMISIIICLSIILFIYSVNSKLSFSGNSSLQYINNNSWKISGDGKIITNNKFKVDHAKVWVLVLDENKEIIDKKLYYTSDQDQLKYDFTISTTSRPQYIEYDFFNVNLNNGFELFSSIILFSIGFGLILYILKKYNKQKIDQL